LDYANLTVIETDGPFGGYSCSATNHSYHEGNNAFYYSSNKLTFPIIAALW